MPMHLFLRRTDSCRSIDSQEDNRFDTVITLFCDMFLTMVSLFALYSFHFQVAKGDFNTHWAPFVGFGIMLLNGLMGILQFGSENAFCSLHCLLDYLQVIVVFPCYACELWLLDESRPPVVGLVLAGSGILPGLMFTLFEVKKRFITDIVILSSMMCVTYLGVSKQDFSALMAAFIFTLSYFMLKRSEPICDEPIDMFNGAMVLFAVFALASLGVELPVPEGIAKLFRGKKDRGGDSGGGDQQNQSDSEGRGETTTAATEAPPQPESESPPPEPELPPQEPEPEPEPEPEDETEDEPPEE